MNTEAALSRTRIPLDLVDLLSITVSQARLIINNQTDTLPGWGDPNKHQYLIARRHVNQEWRDGPRIEHHQRLHDQGKINLCQGRDGSYFLLYAMPNRTIIQRDAYFFTDPGY